MFLGYLDKSVGIGCSVMVETIPHIFLSASLIIETFSLISSVNSFNLSG